MKIIGICGSPRKGNSEFILRTALDSAKENGAEVDLILLRNLNVKFIGREMPDDFNQILPKIIKADGIIFASSCYYDMITPQLLNIIDRLDSHADALKNKKVGIIITGAGDFKSSAKNAVDYLKRVCKIYKMGVVGVVFGKADKAEEISKNSEAILQAKKLGKELSQQ